LRSKVSLIFSFCLYLALSNPSETYPDIAIWPAGSRSRSVAMACVAEYPSYFMEGRPRKRRKLTASWDTRNYQDQTKYSKKLGKELLARFWNVGTGK